MLKNKIDELKKNLAIKKKKELEFQHMNEMENLENAYKREVEESGNKWDSRFSELEDRSKKLDEVINEKHQKEMDELYNFLEEKLPKNVKFSKEYLDLKIQEENLAKQQRYL